MGFWSLFWHSLTPQGRHERYNNTYQRLTGVRPMKAINASTYQLVHTVIRKHGDTATVHLHGRDRRGRSRIEYVPLRFLPGETDAELVRCAAWMSPNKWTVPFGQNIQQYGGKFSAALDDRLLGTLTDPSQISSSSDQ